jgi:hypothetical protein
MGPCLRTACFALVAASAAIPAWAAGTYAGCPLFPVDNYWNTRVDHLPVHESSAAWVASIGASTGLHPDWSNDLADGFGFTPVAVPSSQPGVPIFFSSAQGEAQSDPGPYPIPPALATPGGDREVVVLDRTNCILFELYGRPDGNGGWIAGSAARWDVRSNALRPDGHQSLDQAGLPVLQGLMRWEDVAAGEVTHAIRFTASNAWGRIGSPTGQMKYLWPARHASGDSTNASYPPMGARFRLKSSFDISGFDARTQVVLRGLQRYGMVLSSRGGNWFLQGVSDPGWPDAVIDDLRAIDGDAFEAVETFGMLVDHNSAQAVQPGGGGPAAGPEDGFPPGQVPPGWVQGPGSSAPWVVSNEAFGGSLALKSGGVGAGQKSEVSYSAIFAAGEVTFTRRVEGGAAGTLQFVVDGVVQASWAGDQPWTSFTFALPGGTHTLSWRYAKGSAAPSGADAAWVDGVTLPALAPCRFRSVGGRCLTE